MYFKDGSIGYMCDKHVKHFHVQPQEEEEEAAQEPFHLRIHTFITHYTNLQRELAVCLQHSSSHPYRIQSLLSQLQGIENLFTNNGLDLFWSNISQKAIWDEMRS